MASRLRRLHGLPKNDAADKIWDDHLGNNPFVRHRDQCAICLDAYRTRLPGLPGQWCAEGNQIFDKMLDETLAKIDETLANQN